MSSLAAFLLLVPQVVAPQAPAAASPTLRQVAVRVADDEAWTQLLRGGFDLVHCSGPARRSVELLCTDAELARLAALGHDYELVHQDASGFYAARLEAAEAEAAWRRAEMEWVREQAGGLRRIARNARRLKDQIGSWPTDGAAGERGDA